MEKQKTRKYLLATVFCALGAGGTRHRPVASRPYIPGPYAFCKKLAFCIAAVFFIGLLAGCGSGARQNKYALQRLAHSLQSNILEKLASQAAHSGAGAESHMALPPSCLLQLNNILQLPELPNGCEATSLAMVLRHYGYQVDKLDIAYEYMAREDMGQANGRSMGPNPEKSYAGNPGDDTGYYCLPPVLLRAANRFLLRQNAPERAATLTGATKEQLMALLAGGKPIIAWKTIDNLPAVQDPAHTWYFSDTGEEYTPYTNLHVVVLCGYDESMFYYCDPLEGHTGQGQEEFMQAFGYLGSLALVVE